MPVTLEKTANENHLQTFEILDEDYEPVEENTIAEVSQDASPDDTDDLSVFKKAKEEMSRLGLETLNESTNTLNSGTPAKAMQ